MKVLTVELVASNKRERISGGVYIQFETKDNVKNDDYFKVIVNEYNYYFQANGIKVEGENLIITSKEVGYWAKKLDHKEIDLRTVIGCEVIAITNEEEKKKIYEMSCWC